MLDVLWTPLVIFAIWVYIGLNVFRYKFFKYKDEEKSLILFILFRVIVISIMVTYFFLTFREYVFYCQMKLFWYFVVFIGVAVLEIIYSYNLYDIEDFILFGIVAFGLLYFVLNIILGCILSMEIYEDINKKYIESSTKKYDIIIEGNEKIKNEDFCYGIETYREDGVFYYAFYYLSEDEDEKILEHEVVNQSELKGKVIILEEGENPYFEKITQKYTNKEEIEKKEYIESVSYRLYSSLSDFHGQISEKITTDHEKE